MHITKELFGVLRGTLWMLVFALWLASGHAQAETRLVSVANNTAVSGNNGSIITKFSLNADGTKVAFTSAATNLVAGDTNGMDDVFVRDLNTGTTTRVSVSSSGAQGNRGSSSASISADGTKVAFTSDANNLVASDVNGDADIFVRDFRTGTTAIVSVSSSGAPSDSFSFSPSISADGTKVAFVSSATNLVVGDTNDRADVFVRDLNTGVTTRASVSSDAAQSNNASFNASLSADGTKVAFQSEATNLVADDTNSGPSGGFDIFMHDLSRGITTRVSVSSSGAQGDDDSRGASISADGTKVVFRSEATNLVAGDTNGLEDVFVRDLSNSSTTLVSVSSSGAQGDATSTGASISADGTKVAFTSRATNLVAGDTNDDFDVFVRDLNTGATTRASVSSSAAQSDGASISPSLSANGAKVAFTSVATNLFAGDTNGEQDVFVADVTFGPGPAPIDFGVSITPKAPRTDATLTATPVIADASGVTFSYAWRVNDAVRPNETANTFDLSKAGNGDKGDRVSVVVTATRDGERGTATNFVNVFNSVPTAANATASGDAGALIRVPVTGADADGDALTFKRVGGPRNGTGSFVTDNGQTSFNYTSRAFFNDVEEIRFVALDSEGKNSNVATIRITVTAQPRTINFGVSLLPFGPRSNTVLTAQPVIGDANGVTFAYQWSVNGTVRPGETGQTIDLGQPGNGDKGDTISVVVRATRGIDSGTATNSALIVSAAPVANDATASGNAGEQIVIPISGSDADGDAFTFKRVGGPRNGVGEFVTAADGSVTFVYRSRARFNGTETIRFVAIQANGRSSVPAAITIAVSSDVPDIGFGVKLTPQGPDTNDTLTASLVISSTANTTFSYAWSVNGVVRPGETTNKLDLSKPGNGDRGDRVTAIVTARRGDSVSTSTNSATVTNSAPTTQNASASGISGSEIVVPVVGADIDRDALTFKRVGGPRDGTGSFVTDAGGNTSFVYRSRTGFVGTEEIRFVSVDPLGRTSVPATISINVVAPGDGSSSASGGGAIRVAPAPSGGSS